MINNTSGTIFAYGVNNALFGIQYKRADTQIISSNSMYVKGEDNLKLGGIPVVITDVPTTYLVKTLTLEAQAAYTISGNILPGNVWVYISYNFKRSNIDTLRDSVMLCVKAEEDGYFNFDYVHNPYCTTYIWASILPTYVQTANINYAKELLVDNTNMPVKLVNMAEPTDTSTLQRNLRYDSFEILKEAFPDITAAPEYDVQGKCSWGIDRVYVSAAARGATESELLNTIVTSKITENGRFFLRFIGEFDQSYVVWGISQEAAGYVTIHNYIVPEEPEEPEEPEVPQEPKVEVKEDTSCLSGDTLISMADGTVKRLDCLKIGDKVLSKENKVTDISVLCRGYFSNKHIIYHFADGTIIDETHPHRFYNYDQGFYQRLQLWNLGDRAVNQKGELIALTKVDQVDEPAEMFGLWTTTGTYFANGLLSGTAECNKEFLANATAEQAINMLLSVDEKALIELAGLEGVLP